VGDEIRIEIQGSMGVENRLTQQAIDQADLVVFAVNISIEGRDRFSKKNPLPSTRRIRCRWCKGA
jgi:fructose-specific phosphotransferase system component IIB